MRTLIAVQQLAGLQQPLPFCTWSRLAVAQQLQRAERVRSCRTVLSLTLFTSSTCALSRVGAKFSESLVSVESECHEENLKGLVTTTLSPRRGPREAFQAKATPRVDVAEVPGVPSSQQALCVKSCFDQFPGLFGDCTPGSQVTPLPGLSFLLVTLSGKTLTVYEDPGLLVSELLDKISVLSALRV